MYISNAGRSVLSDMMKGWILVQGKVIPGAKPTTMLRDMQGGRIQEVRKVSNGTLQSLLKNELVTQSGEDLTVNYYYITPKGKKVVKAP